MTTEIEWPWFEPFSSTDLPDDDTESEPSLTVAFARCFATVEGRRVLRHLRSLTLERTMSAAVSDAQLRHLEGQRQLVAYILGLIAQGTNRL